MSAALPSLLLSALLGTLLAAQPARQAARPAAPLPQPAAEATPQDIILNAKIPYNPTLQRDPFGSPTDLAKDIRAESIDEIGVKGWMVMQGRPYAIITDSRGKTRRIPNGYRFKDGEVVAIDATSVTFKQWDPTSTNRSVFKTVVKSFKREEGKR
jgi:hypothetical protein